MEEIIIFCRKNEVDLNKVKFFHRYVSMNLYVSEQGKGDIHTKIMNNSFSNFAYKAPTTVIMKGAVFYIIKKDADVSDKWRANRSVCHLHLQVSCFPYQKTAIFISTVSLFHVLLKLQHIRVLFAVPSHNANVEQIIYLVSSHGRRTRHNIYEFVEMDSCY
jgi:hypothetical protein